MSKRYLVAFGNLATTPLEDAPPCGIQQEEFTELERARDFAIGMSRKWIWVVVYDRDGEGGLRRIEMYRDGRRYTE